LLLKTPFFIHLQDATNTPVMEIEGIDLNLAINYIPACLVVGKTLLLLFFLELIEVFRLYNAIVVLFLLVCIDRVYSHNYFFDGNMILLFLVFHHLCLCLQRNKHYSHPTLNMLWQILCVLWFFLSFYIQSNIINGHYSQHWRFHFCITCCFIAISPFIDYDSHETALYRISRGLIFCVFSLFWMYVIGVYKRRITSTTDTGIYFIIYFSICLFAPMFVTIAYCATVFLVVVWKTFVTVRAAQESVMSYPPLDETESHTNDLEELQLLLRQAKERNNNSSKP
jgi:hypothetical protein